MSEDCLLVEGEECLDIDTGPSTVEEVRAAINHLKNGKSPGADVIDADLWEYSKNPHKRTHACFGGSG